MNLPNATSIYGASMGRAENRPPAETPVKFYLQRVRLNQGGYDSGGAYWGIGQPLYHAWGEGFNEDYDLFLRADSRENAKERLRAKYPLVTFARA